jgi:hypothetical protein
LEVSEWNNRKNKNEKYLHQELNSWSIDQKASSITTTLVFLVISEQF